jgi:hypothetical protein
MQMSPIDEAFFIPESLSTANGLGLSRLVVVCYPREIITRKAAERCARSPHGKDMMRLPARSIMGTLRNYWEWLARRAAWLAVQTALEEYDG